MSPLHWYRRWRVRRRLKQICKPWAEDREIWRDWSAVVVWQAVCDLMRGER